MQRLASLMLEDFTLRNGPLNDFILEVKLQRKAFGGLPLVAPAHRSSKGVQKVPIMNDRLHRTPIGYVVALFLLTGGGTLAQTPPDNTKVNRQPSQATADQQPNNRSDLEIARQIRKSLVADKSLSTYGHNVKIVSKAGTVTLTGPVRSDDEKKSIETKAIAVAGAGNVVNQLTVKTTAPASSTTRKPSTKKAGA